MYTLFNQAQIQLPYGYIYENTHIYILKCKCARTFIHSHAFSHTGGWTRTMTRLPPVHPPTHSLTRTHPFPHSVTKGSKKEKVWGWSGLGVTGSKGVMLYCGWKDWLLPIPPSYARKQNRFSQFSCCYVIV